MGWEMDIIVPPGGISGKSGKRGAGAAVGGANGCVQWVLVSAEGVLQTEPK